jgi:hypothetical protein
VIDIELWGGPVDGHVMQVDSLRPVWHVPMMPSMITHERDDIMALINVLNVPEPETAVYERAALSTTLPQRYLYRGMLAG